MAMWFKSYDNFSGLGKYCLVVEFSGGEGLLPMGIPCLVSLDAGYKKDWQVVARMAGTLVKW